MTFSSAMNIHNINSRRNSSDGDGIFQVKNRIIVMVASYLVVCGAAHWSMKIACQWSRDTEADDTRNKMKIIQSSSIYDDGNSILIREINQRFEIVLDLYWIFLLEQKFYTWKGNWQSDGRSGKVLEWCEVNPIDVDLFAVKFIGQVLENDYWLQTIKGLYEYQKSQTN